MTFIIRLFSLIGNFTKKIHYMKTTSKFLAIWLDHEKAYLIEPATEPIIQTIHSSEKASSWSSQIAMNLEVVFI